ncbi:MAG: gamma-glutamylcyclotransferase family protein [Polyangiaceae bacterium]
MLPLAWAYGSNLDVAQMRARCPSARLLEPAMLRHARLVFRGHSKRWGGAVATVVWDPSSVVYGALYRLELADLARLDAFEGVPFVYARVRVSLCDVYGRRRRAQAYVRARGGRCRAPSPDYLLTILRAYEALGFDLAPLLRAAFSEEP